MSYPEPPPTPNPQPHLMYVQVVPPTGPPSSTYSTVAVVFGFLSLLMCCFGVSSILAVIFGLLGLRETKNDAMTGRGRAQIGLVLGCISLIPSLLVSIYALAD